MSRLALRGPTGRASRWTPVVGIAVIGLGVEALTTSGGSPLSGVILVALASLMIILRASLRTTGLWSAYLAAFTLPWNGYQIGPVRPGDLLILVALLCFVAADARAPFPRLPNWVAWPGLVVLLVLVLHEVLPTSPHYLAQRVVVDATGQPTVEVQSNIEVGAKLLIAVVGVSLALCYVVRERREAARRLAVGYGLGAAVSAVIAFTDSKGITSGLGNKLTHNSFSGSRTAGLSDHPNFLAASCALSVPIGIWLLTQRRTSSRALGALILVLNVLGVYSSGSRGGAVAVVVAVVLTVVALPVFRPYLAPMFFGALFIVVASYALFPDFAHAVLKATRLTGGGVSTAGSDEVREIVARQGIDDFKFSPIDGVGYQVGAEAQNVYLQQLAAGGLMLFVSMQLFWLFGIVAAWRLRDRHPLARTLAATVVVAEVLNIVGASLTDRFMYLQIGIVAALASYRPDRPDRFSAEGHAPAGGNAHARGRKTPTPSVAGRVVGQ